MKRINLLLVLTVGLSLSTGARAVILDFDAAASGQFFTNPYSEDGFTIEVDSGHYDIFGTGGDQYFNIDEQMFGLTTVTLSMDGGGLFDVVSLDVIQAAIAPNVFEFVAIGGAGSVSAPTVQGLFNFGAGFQGISALVLTQNVSAAGIGFAFDDLTLEPVSVPEPGTLVLLVIGIAGMRLAKPGTGNRH